MTQLDIFTENELPPRTVTVTAKIRVVKINLPVIEEESFLDGEPDEDAPVEVPAKCPRCHIIHTVEAMPRLAYQLRKYCPPCARVAETGEEGIWRISPSEPVQAAGRVAAPEVIVYRKGEIPAELLELYRRTK